VQFPSNARSFFSSDKARVLFLAPNRELDIIANPMLSGRPTRTSSSALTPSITQMASSINASNKPMYFSFVFCVVLESHARVVQVQTAVERTKRANMTPTRVPFKYPATCLGMQYFALFIIYICQHAFSSSQRKILAQLMTLLG
jgi:hypothetical protein